ncbi:hypothetical protein IWQ61_010300 [Dispira simplex]|nr:hypothetical protein IWQ61_010300 [Dispira simplex]
MAPTSHDYQALLNELRVALEKVQPDDLYQYCAYYFQEKLAHQRAQLLAMVQDHPQLTTLPFAPQPASKRATVPAITQGLQHSQLAVATNNSQGPTEELLGSHNITTARDATLEDPEDDLMQDTEEQGAHNQVAPSEPDPMLAYNRGRRTSVSAESMAPTTDQDFVRVVVPKTAEQHSRIYSSIASNFLFRNLDDEQYKDVVDAMVEKTVSNGEEVIQQGDIGDFFYVVETGSFEVFVAKDGKPPIKVYQYGPGGSFGELALMYNSPRAATVRATSDSVLWALDRVTFRRILMERTSRKRRLYEEFLEEVPLLVSLEPYERHKIADALESVVFEDNEVVISQGDVGENFYIIESGEATVTKEENGVIRTYPSLKKGDYFGELALLNDKPRQATIRAKGRLKCATLGKKAFVRLLGPVVDIIKRNTANYQLMNYIE